jgi:hypothetical protein
MSLRFEVENFDEVENFILTVREQLPVRTMEGLVEMAQNIVNNAKAIAPVKTGEYQSLIDWRMEGDNSVVVFAGADYSAVVEYGSKPHPIDGNPFLIFYFDKMGKMVAMPHVEHPGTTGQLVLSQAADLVWSQCDRITNQILDDVIDP